MEEPRNSGLFYAYAYLHVDRHHQLQPVESPQALLGPGGGEGSAWYG